MTRSPQILVLDDEKMIGWSCETIFQGHADVHYFAKVDDALGFAERSQVDLAIVDVRIGGDAEAGLEVIRQVSQKNGATLPIIAVSGHQDEDLAERCITAGAYDFLSKPFRGAEMRARALRHLETSAALADAGVMRQLAEQESQPINFAGAKVDPRQLLIRFPDGRPPVKLVKKQVQILQLLTESVGGVLHREVLLRKVWGADADKDGRSVNVYISNIKGLYKDHGIDLSERIVAIYGEGWRVTDGDVSNDHAAGNP